MSDSALSVAPLEMDEVVVVPQCALRIPGDLALRRLVLPFMEEDGVLLVACADPGDVAALGTVERLAERPVRPEPAEPESLRRAILRIYGKNARRAPGPASVGSGATSSGATTSNDDFVRLVDEILTCAVLRRASDLHFEPAPDHVLVRLRVDGHLEETQRLTHAAWGGALGRIKVLARMDIAEKRLPQDGQITWQNESTGQRFSIRAATVPSRYGEKATLRFLGLHASSSTLSDLGMSEEHRRWFTDAVTRPHGLVLITGPTGSGKTSTIYAALRHIQADRSKSIITIEDPVECDLPGVTQIDVDGDRLTYAHALRSVLRHDPDVILIGEIRDPVSADIAVRAALTGHLVLSTLHTHDAAGAVTRLRDLGVEPYLLAATLHFAAAQRLVKRLCPRCRTPVPLDAASAHALRSPESAGRTVYSAEGCKYCAGQGTVGRFALFEMLPLSPVEVDAFMGGGSGGPPRGGLIADAWKKLEAGETTPAEVIRVFSAG